MRHLFDTLGSHTTAAQHELAERTDVRASLGAAELHEQDGVEPAAGTVRHVPWTTKITKATNSLLIERVRRLSALHVLRGSDTLRAAGCGELRRESQRVFEPARIGDP